MRLISRRFSLPDMELESLWRNLIGAGSFFPDILGGREIFVIASRQKNFFKETSLKDKNSGRNKI